MMRVLLPVHLCLFLLSAGLTTGCGREGERCAKCGMLVDDAPRWIAGVTTKAGRSRRFCSPRCLFSWLRSPGGEGSRDPWVTEYYSGKPTPVADVVFVAGSDVIGPMGKSLVPVKGRDAAERFLKDHQGTHIFNAKDITRQKLKEIAGKTP